MRLNQVTLPATNVPRSVEFYTRLGLIHIVDGGEDYARFECPDGDSTFSIHRVDQVLAPNAVTVYFECDDLDTTVEGLRESGFEFVSAPEDKRWLWREARVHDPDGNEICLFYAGENRKYPPWRLRPV
jgi:catechol 2,3-dioxygenase-like lactoylglutathione lyase family enzyme